MSETNSREQFDLFLDEIRSCLQERVGGDASVEVCRRTGNNGVKKTGIVLNCEYSGISPVIYIDRLFDIWRFGGSISGMCDHLYSCFERAGRQKSNRLSIMDSYVEVRGQLCLRLVNREKNEYQKSEYICRDFLDLMFVVCVKIRLGESETGITCVTRQQILQWKVTEDEVWNDAVKSSAVVEPWQILMMEDVLNEETDRENRKGQMYVLTNRSQNYGASVIVYPGVFQELSRRMKGDMIFLPSSVHEWIVVKRTDMHGEEGLKEMIEEINETVVDEQDRLSDHPYVYLCEQDQFVCL